MKTYTTQEEVETMGRAYHYRKSKALKYLAAGFGGFRVVDSVTRGSAKVDWTRTDKDKWVIECRPSSAGRYGKSVSYRMVPRA